jgi:radical SAM protein with 4Fe4S-binding SPASM domain
MPLEHYIKAINDMTKFPHKIKVLRFVGIGEPLLHKDIERMIFYARRKKVADKIELITNGYLLTHEKSLALIDAGLSRLVISIQGTSAEDYKNNSKIKINFEKFVENIKFFYNNKKNSEIYIKIVDSVLKNKNNFYKIFGNICDYIAIENTVPIHAGIKYTEKVLSKKVTQFGLPIKKIKVCPQSFFHMQINPDGNVVPCYSFEYPCVIGNCTKESLLDIWHGEKMRDFRYKMLTEYKNNNNVCSKCNMITYRIFQEDILDDSIDILKGKYKCK